MMLPFACVIAALLLSTPSVQAGRVHGQIVGGKDAVQNRFPYYASLRETTGWTPSHFCGGSVIDLGDTQTSNSFTGKVILTAAHCFDGVVKGRSFTDRSRYNPLLLINPYADSYKENSFKPSGPTYQRTTYGTWVHPDYSPNNIVDGYDVALILLDGQIESPATVSRVKIPPPASPKPGAAAAKDTKYAAGATMGAVGLGYLKNEGAGWFASRKDTQNLMDVDLPVNSLVDCNKQPGLGQGFNAISDTRFCAGYIPPATDSRQYKGYCQGDSGGPTFLRGADATTDEQVGIVSYSAGLAPCGGEPDVLTSVAAVRSWIDDMVRQFKQNYTEYTLEMSIKTPDANGQDQDFAGEFHSEAQDAAAAWASAVIGKTNGIHVNFYQFTGGVLKMKFTSKKKMPQMTALLTSGQLSTAQAPKTVFSSQARSYLKGSLDDLSSDLASALFGFSRHFRLSQKTISVPTITLKTGHLGEKKSFVWRYADA